MTLRPKAAELVSRNRPKPPSVTGRTGATQLRSQPPGFYRLMLGDAEITARLDGTNTFPIPTALQAPADGADAGPRGLLEEVHPGEAAARLAEERLGLPFEGLINAFLVNLDSHVTLIDTGAGELYSACCGHLIENLRAAGYQPGQVWQPANYTTLFGSP